MIKHKHGIQLAKEPLNQPRRSARLRNSQINLAYSTIWKPSDQPSQLYMNYHPMLLTTYIVAEPAQGLKKMENDVLNMEFVKNKQVNHNYLAYVDIINHILSPDSLSRYWEVQSIENHVTKQGQTWIKVLWKTGYKSWVKLEDLKSDDPLILIQYAKSDQLSHLKEWNWTKKFNQDLNLFQVMVQNTKCSTENTYKLVVRVPKTTKQAL